MSQQLGKIIKRVRKGLSLSQTSLAEKSGLSQSLLSGIERGEKSPTIRTLKKIAEALDLSIEDLLSQEIQSDKINEKEVSIIEKRKLEEEINNGIGRLYKDIIGHGPKFLKTRIIEDIVILRIKNYPTNITRYLMRSQNGKKVYRNLIKVIFENSREEIIQVLNKITGSEVKEIYFDKKNLDPLIVLTIIFKESIF